MEILNEMKDWAPDVLDFLATIAVPNLKDNGGQAAPLCVAYGVSMNQRFRQLSLVQKITSVLLGTGSATKEVILIINNLQLSLQFVFFRLNLFGAFSLYTSCITSNTRINRNSTLFSFNRKSMFNVFIAIHLLINVILYISSES